jgi:microcystin-dependent protein
MWKMFKQKSFCKYMAYRSSINQRNLEQTFYSNTSITTDSTNPNSPATVLYVQSQINPINTQITNLNNTATALQASILSLQNQAALIQSQLVRVIGSIVMVMSNDVPPYTLLCNGSSVSTTTYADLFAVIGYNYGGSGANFNLPNFQSHFPVGGNNNVNGVSVSNIMTGNGQSGATNTYSVANAPWTYSPTQPSFPIINRAPAHNHTITDNGHTHFVSDTGYTNLPVAGTTPFLSTTSTVGDIVTQSSKTGISIQSAGTNIQATDPNSGVSGVNVCPPYIAANFYITYA